MRGGGAWRSKLERAREWRSPAARFSAPASSAATKSLSQLRPRPEPVATLGRVLGLGFLKVISYTGWGSFFG